MKPTQAILLPILCLLTLAGQSSVFAAKEVFERTKPHVNVGTLGQAGEVKLSLAAAIDAASEPGLPGVVIYLDTKGETPLEALWIEVETEAAQYDIYDFDNQDTIDNMRWGGVLQDGSILVVSAAEGPTPQTQDHVLLARQAGVPAIVVFLDLDGVQDPSQVAGVEWKVRALLDEAGYNGDRTPVIRGSAARALRGDSQALLALADLLDALDASLVQP